MSTEATTERETRWAEIVPLEVPQPPTNLVFDDGEPLESNRHRIAMNVLIDSAQAALSGREDFFVGGNMFLYYSSEQVLNRDFRGPDFFVVLDIDGSRDRQGWVVWQEGGRYPDMIIELMSPSTAKVDRTEKKRLYERTFHTTEYFIFDPFDPQSLQGWHLDNKQRYQSLEANESGRLWCETLQVWLGTWSGRIRREPAQGTCHWLRLYDQKENLILLQEEIAEQEQQRAEQEQQRAERLAARLRELGEDPDAI
ncbi:MAG: Uma2 family endonuclease [Stigonema ocellatum SAG 48.90 = DSM 106950]|nr:Uma2 family endonuclease [Stigonema ocellatum SAG 48.90 = DSM 106950]